MKIVVPILALVLINLSCAVNPVSGKKDFMLLSEQQEIAMGREADPEIVEMFGLYDHPEAQKFLNDLGQEMAAISHRSHLTYTFRLLDSPVLNAFALPGGYVYFTRGIMAQFNNEAEFAGVLGHEIGHITARHSAKQYSGQVIAQAGYTAGVLLMPEFSSLTGSARDALNMMFLQFGRDHESQSDELGVEYSTAIGYDASQLANFFQVLDRAEEESEQESIPDFMSTHPDPGDRYHAVLSHAAEAQADKEGVEWKVNRENYLNLIDGFVYGRDPRKGFIEDDTYYHPERRVQLPVPPDWQTDIAKDGLLAAPEEGDALLFFMRDDSSSTPGSSARKFADRLDLGVTNLETTNYNDLGGKYMEADLANPRNPSEVYRLSCYFVDVRGSIYQLVFVTIAATHETYARAIATSIREFRELKDEEYLNRQPERIDIFTADSDATIDQILLSAGVDDDRLKEIIALNGMTPGAPVTRGTLLKRLRT